MSNYRSSHRKNFVRNMGPNRTQMTLITVKARTNSSKSSDGVSNSSKQEELAKARWFSPQGIGCAVVKGE